MNSNLIFLLIILLGLYFNNGIAVEQVNAQKVPQFATQNAETVISDASTPFQERGFTFKQVELFIF